MRRWWDRWGSWVCPIAGASVAVTVGGWMLWQCTTQLDRLIVLTGLVFGIGHIVYWPRRYRDQERDARRARS